MTAHANGLTERANERGGAGGAAPTVPSVELRAFIDAFERLGYDVEGLLAGAGIRRSDLLDPDARLPCEAYPALLSRAQRQRFTPNIGLRLASQIPIGAFPLLDYLIVTADTVGAGLRQLARYFHLTGSPIVIEIHEESDPAEVRMLESADPFAVEYTSTLLVLHMREETGGRFASAGICFRHRPDDPAECERVLGCPVHAGAPWNGVSIAKDTWQLPMRRRDPVLRGVLEQQADGIPGTRAPDGGAAGVRHVLAARLARGDTRIHGVARELATSARTLQRRLAAEGVSYQQILDDVRREAAARHVADSRLAIAEVAYLLGYAEPAPFHRAFKRWFGVTPQAFRKAGGA